MPERYSNNLGHWIKRYHLLTAREMDAVLKPHGLGRTQWYIVFHVHASGEISQRSLQALLQVESATLTGLVAALVRKGWVQQSPDPHDRRSKRLRLTDEGRRRWDTLPDPIDQVRQKAWQGIPADDIQLARRVVEAAVRNLESASEGQQA